MRWPLEPPGPQTRLVKVSQPLRLVVHLPLHIMGKTPEGLDDHTPALVPPGSGNAAVDEKRRHRLRRLRAEHTRPVLLRKDLRAARVREQGRVPHGEEANRRGRLWVGKRRPRQIDQLTAALVLKAA